MNPSIPPAPPPFDPSKFTMPTFPVAAPTTVGGTLVNPFTAPTQLLKITPRLAISLEALEKCGKTHWALFTAPEPLAVITNDPGTPLVLQKAISAGRRIPYVIQQSWEKAERAVIQASQIDKSEQALAKKEWDRFVGATNWLADASAEAKSIKTLVIDNGTDLAQLCEQAIFGKLRGNARIDFRADYNDAMTRWFGRLYNERQDLNIIIIHRLKKQYTGSKEKSEWTGKYERQGFNQVGYLVDMSVRCHWDGSRKDFYTELDPDQNTRFGSDQLGRKFYSRPYQIPDATGRPEEPSGFITLAMNVFPETAMTPEVWGLR